MSVLNGKDYLYLIWQDEKTRRQYIVGQLSKNGQYEFRYMGEVDEAVEKGFQYIIPFEERDRIYYSEDLFASFASRLPDRKRKDIKGILQKYGLEEYNPYELLKMSGARLPIDNIQFIDPILNFDRSFTRKFYMAGTRHYLGCDGEKCEKALSISVGDIVDLRKENDNKFDTHAIAVFNNENKKVGYIPRYYSEAYDRLITANRKIECEVVGVDKSKFCSECVLLSVDVY